MLKCGMYDGKKKIKTNTRKEPFRDPQFAAFVPSLHAQSQSGNSLGSLSKDVFERRTSTGSEAFSLFIYLGANKFVLLSFFSLVKTIYQRVSTKPLLNDAKRPLPVDVRRSKTPLLKLPNNFYFIPDPSGCKTVKMDVY